MEKNSGIILKYIAIGIGILSAIAACIGICYIADYSYEVEGTILLASSISCALFGIMIFGFGDLIDNAIRSNRNNYETQQLLREMKDELVKLRKEKTENIEEDTAIGEEESVSSSEEAKEDKKPFDSDELFMYEAKKMNNAKEIAEDFFIKYEKEESQDFQRMKQLLTLLQKRERLYGNMTHICIAYLESFFEKGKKVFEVDCSNQTIECPLCGRRQTSNRDICVRCGALFISKPESVEEKPEEGEKKTENTAVNKEKKNKEADSKKYLIKIEEELLGLSSVSEIYDEFYGIFGSIEDENIQCVLNMLNKEKSKDEGENQEDTNRATMRSARNIIRAFFKHGMKVFWVDRYDEMMICPVCKKELPSSRKGCHHCGALFRD